MAFLAEIVRFSSSMHIHNHIVLAAKAEEVMAESVRDLSEETRMMEEIEQIGKQIKEVQQLLNDAYDADRPNWCWTGGGMHENEWERKGDSYGSEAQIAIEEHRYKRDMLYGQLAIKEIAMKFRFDPETTSLMAQYLIRVEMAEAIWKRLWNDFSTYNVEEHEDTVPMSNPGARILDEYSDHNWAEIRKLEKQLGINFDTRYQLGDADLVLQPMDEDMEMPSVIDLSEIYEQRYPKQERMHSDYKKADERRLDHWGRSWKNYRKNQTRAQA